MASLATYARPITWGSRRQKRVAERKLNAVVQASYKPSDEVQSVVESNRTRRQILSTGFAAAVMVWERF